MMFCRFCGSQLKEDAKFCSICGNTVKTEDTVSNEAAMIKETANAAPIADVQPVVSSSPILTQPAISEAELSSKQGSVLTFGILALAVSAVFINFLGIIFGAIAMNKAKEYTALTGKTPARVSVGKGLGKAGLITGIAMTAFWTLYIGFIVLMTVALSY